MTSILLREVLLNYCKIIQVPWQALEPGSISISKTTGAENVWGDKFVNKKREYLSFLTIPINLLLCSKQRA
jgi:hypothetical protein